jgi:hypothetical protein
MGEVRVDEREVRGCPAAKILKVSGLVILGLIAASALAILFGLLVQWLWNALMPDIFGLPHIGYWQAVGLAVLAHIFFGGHHKALVYKSHKKSCGSGKKHFHINHNGAERHYDSFRKFWNDEGREAFDKWLNGKEESKPKEEI